MGIRPQKIPPPDSKIAQNVLEQTETFFQDVKKNAMQAYLKYKAYYDRKANASKLKIADYVFILQPKADHQGSKIPLTDFRWIGPYIIEKVFRKISTNKTQLLHRMSPHPANRYQTYQSHNVSGNQTQKLSLHTMICTPGRGNVNTTSHYLTAIIIIW